MSDNFQQTVDLRGTGREAPRRTSTPKKPAAPIDKIYQTETNDEPAPDMKKINRPGGKTPRSADQKSGLFRLVVFILAIIVVGATIYSLFIRHRGTENSSNQTTNNNWYAVKLVDGTIYYGQIADVKAEPVVVANVYYNYDQAKQTGAAKDQTKTIEETGNLRLVKRGRETLGGDGSMLMYHVNILVMEALRSDSKVLKAILEYEKK